MLRIAFVLSLVPLFLQGNSRWTGITALILSIVGAIAGVAVFFTVVTNSFDESLGNNNTTVVEPSEGAVFDKETAEEGVAEEDAAAVAGTRESPHPVGSVIESDECRVVINSVALAATVAVVSANQFNDRLAEASEYMLVNYSTTYSGDHPDGQMPAFVTVEYVTAHGTTVNSFDNSTVAPEATDTTSTLYADGTATDNIAFEVPTATADQGFCRQSGHVRRQTSRRSAVTPAEERQKPRWITGGFCCARKPLPPVQEHIILVKQCKS